MFGLLLRTFPLRHAEEMVPTPAVATHTPDRRWWWDGARWVPAFSDDGRRWFDGVAWREVEPRWLRKSRLAATIWFGASLVLLIPVYGYAAGEPSGNPPTKEPHIFAVAVSWFIFATMSIVALLVTLIRGRRCVPAPPEQYF